MLHVYLVIEKSEEPQACSQNVWQHTLKKLICKRRGFFLMISRNGTRDDKSSWYIQATDKDKPGTDNSNITYSLSSTTPPGLTGHFHIDPLTGDITVVQPLDFENIAFSAGQAGAITLTAVASDHGLGPLSSTVEVSITLLVRISLDPVMNILQAYRVLWVLFYVK